MKRIQIGKQKRTLSEWSNLGDSGNFNDNDFSQLLAQQ